MHFLEGIGAIAKAGIEAVDEDHQAGAALESAVQFGSDAVQRLLLHGWRVQGLAVALQRGEAESAAHERVVGAGARIEIAILVDGHAHGAVNRGSRIVGRRGRWAARASGQNGQYRQRRYHLHAGADAGLAEKHRNSKITQYA